jgi:tRNA dimethylallyltransferase
MTKIKKPSLICLMGPTAAGKTGLAVELTQHFPCEIISVDSAMVYRGMDIGTAKPTADILQIAPHHLIDIRDPAEPYSAAQFCHDAKETITAILARGKIPLMVGGTMLYFNALQKGLSDLPVANPEVRAQLSAEAESTGWPAMHERLKTLDIAAYDRIHPHDAQRIQRALEVHAITGLSLSSAQQRQSSLLEDYQVINLAVAPAQREVLHAHIAARFAEMLAAGFLQEVESLYRREDLSPETPAMRSVGYRQLWEHLQGTLSLSEASEKAIAATRQLAKRQLTWLRHWSSDLIWFDSMDDEVFIAVKNHLQKFL